MYKNICKRNGKVIVFRWELNFLEGWSIEKLRNWIWLGKACNVPIPGCVSVEALRMELARRGEVPIGYHETENGFNMRNIIIDDGR